MRIVHTVPHLRTEASGYGQSVPALCRELVRRGHDVTVHALAPRPSRSFEVPTDFHRPLPFTPGRLGVSPSMRFAIHSAADKSDIIHVNSLWTMSSIYPYRATRSTGARLVLSPHGMLDAAALRISAGRKQLFWHLAQRRVFERADLVHATSQIEATSIRRMGIEAPIAVIPNGIDIPPRTEEFTGARPYRTLLTLGRLAPIKNLETLLVAWERLEPRHLDWRLRIVGPDSDRRYAARIRSMAERLERVDVMGPLFGAEKRREYWSADLFVLPTHSENFGMVVAESLTHEVPVIVTKGAPWSGLVEQKCGWWIDHGVDSLSDTLNQALDLPGATLRSMGERGRTWMERDFSWASIAEQMEAAYLWAGGIGPQPPFLSLVNDVLER